MPTLSDFQIGQTILHQNRSATVAFIGSTHFAPGDWIGIVHEDPVGKNNGEVQGEKYFECEPNHGMFVRPAAVTTIVDDGETPRPAERRSSKITTEHKTGMNGSAVKSSRQSMLGGSARRTSVVDPATKKRGSINDGSPTPGARRPLSSRLASPTKSPTKPTTPRPSSISSTGGAARNALSAASSTTATPKTSRTSILGPSIRPSGTSRASITGVMHASSKLGTRTPSERSRIGSDRMSLQPTAVHRTGSNSARSQMSQESRHASPPSHSEAGALSPSIGEEDEDNFPEEPRMATADPSVEGKTKPLVNGTAKRGRSPALPSNLKSPPANSREVEALQTKIRVLEKKRMEDRERLKDLDRLQEERDRFEGVIQKLQSKYQPQQEEISALRRQLQEALDRANNAQAHSVEHDSAVEMATLDREMAEETADGLRSDLEALRQKYEEMELEIEILREENNELGKEMSPEERTSQGWAQMERSNERLREALMRLRDVSQQQEADLKGQVDELEKDLENLGNVREERDAIKERLMQSEAALDDLRQQLDVALGAEEMIEELTDRNDTLNQRLADAKGTIEELESLRELNDELELNHVETEKQMQDDIDYNESLLAEQKRKTTTQESTIQDLEYTVSRFRELVSTMQSDLEELRTSRKLSEAEANELSSKSKDMMDLNLRLQTSAAKAQVRAIDLEMSKMDAQQSAEHLAIVQHLLPDSFQTERNCVLAFLRCKRITFKADLLHNLVKDLAESTGKGLDPFACCDVLNKLTILSTSSKGFADFMQICDLESFAKLESALHDLDPVEKALTGWMEDVKRETFKEVICGQEIRRLNSLISHLIDVHVKETLASRTSETKSCALVLQSYIESAAICITQIKTIANSKIPLSTDQDLDSGSEEVHAAHDFARQADDVVSALHGLKAVVQKSVRNLNDLFSRSLTLDPTNTASTTIEQALEVAENTASSAQNMGSSLLKLINEEGRTAALTYDEIVLTLSADDNPFSPLTTLLPSLNAPLHNFHMHTSTLSNTIEIPPSPPAPWVLLAQSLKQESTKAKANEDSLARLQQEMSQKNTSLALREKDKEEMGVQIEVLTQRVNESGGRRERVRELEESLKTIEHENKVFKKELEKREKMLSGLEDEKKVWARNAGPPPSPRKRPSAAANGDSAADLPPSAATTSKLSALEAEIAAQRAAIRHMQSQQSDRNHREDMAFLSTPLVTTPPQPTQASYIQDESRACLSTLLSLATSAGAQPIRLNVRLREERLKWQSREQSSEWRLSVLREEYEGWSAWARDLTKKAQKEAKRRQALEGEPASGKPYEADEEVQAAGSEGIVTG